MQVCNEYYKNPTFGLIKLEPKDLNKSEQLLRNFISCKQVETQKNSLAVELYNLLKPYLDKEAKKKASHYYILKEVISELKVKFMEIINSANNKTGIDNIIEELNTYKPSKNISKPEYKHKSIDVPIPGRSRALYSDLITKDNLPIPQSEIEIDNIRQTLANTIESSDLTIKNKNRLTKKGAGLTYDEIANEENNALSTVYQSIKKGVLKIQKANNTLSEENKKQITEFAKILGISFDEALQAATRAINILSLSPDKLKNNVKKSAGILGLPKNEFIKITLRQPQLLLVKPETLRQNAEKTSDMLKIRKTDFIKAAINQPSLFCMSPETLNKNIEASAAILEIPKSDYIKTALKCPSLLYQSPITLNKNVEMTANLLQLSKNEFIKAALRYPQLLYQSPETLNKNVEVSAKLLEIPKENFIKAILKQPSLLARVPESLKKNVETSSDLIGIQKEDFIKIALRYPSLFYQSPETLNKNIEKAANLFGVTKSVLAETSLNFPQLLCLSPENMNKNIEKSATLFEMSKNELVKTALDYPIIFSLKPETLQKKSKIITYYKKLQNKNEKISILSSMKSFDTHYKNILNYLVRKNVDKEVLKKKVTLPELLTSSTGTIKIQLPQSEVAEDFIKFAEDYSTKIVGKNIFEFTII